MPNTNLPTNQGGGPSIGTVDSTFQSTTKAGVSQNAIAANFAWTQFPRIDAFGTIDPQKNADGSGYWKPDSNIQAPGKFPITNLLPGTVTSVQRTTWGQTVVTVKLDTALNQLATHTFYEHLSSANVTPGQHVASGTLIGFNNPSGQVPVGFGLYSGDVYGSGSAWAVLQNDLKPGGAGLLNPTALLNNFRAGKGPTGANIDQNSKSQSLPQNAPGCAIWDIGCWMNNLVSFGEHIAIFLLALVFIIVGFMFLMGGSQVGQTVGKIAKIGAVG